MDPQETALPLVSVLMAVHDIPAEFLDAAVTGILDQSLSDFEFIIVDDGSDAATAGRLYFWAERDSRIRLHILPANIGLTKALNVGLGLVRGAYVARQDADDISGPGRLAAQIDYLDAHPEIDAVCTNTALIDETGARTGGITIDPSLKGLPRRNLLVHGAMMFRRRVFDRLGGYDERMRLAQDYELYLRMTQRQAMKIGVVAGEHYCLRRHSSSLSSRRMFRQLYFAVMAKSLARGGDGKAWGKLAFGINLLIDYVFTHRLFIGAILRNLARRRVT